MIAPERKFVFDKLLGVLDTTEMVSRVMLTGPWAEYIYEHAQVLKGYSSFTEARDMDILVMNLRPPFSRTDFPERMKEAGFQLETYLGGEMQRFKQSDPQMTVRFLAIEKGAGSVTAHHIKPLGITIEGLRDLDILQSTPLAVLYETRYLVVPEPEAYVLHAFVAERKQTREELEKEIEALRKTAVMILDLGWRRKILFTQVWARLSKKQQEKALSFMRQHAFHNLLKILEPGIDKTRTL